MRKRVSNLILVTGIWFATGFPILGDDVAAPARSALPIGKLAYVTSNSFGAYGEIHFEGHQSPAIKGHHPQFTQDGENLIYDVREAAGQAFVIRSLSTIRLRKIKHQTFGVDSPALSPAGSKLLFVGWSEDHQTSHIHVANSDGSDSRPLTNGGHYNWWPRWSRDGTMILFESTRDGQRQIYKMNVDGTNQVNLSNDMKLSHAPAWSPDGYQIAYMSRGENDTASIFVMNNDRTEKRNISRSATRDSEPAWSPDGEWIAFTRTASVPAGATPMDVWIMRRDGTDQRRITYNKSDVASYSPSWGR